MKYDNIAFNTSLSFLFMCLGTAVRKQIYHIKRGVMSTKLIRYSRKTIYSIQLHKSAHASHGA